MAQLNPDEHRQLQELLNRPQIWRDVIGAIPLELVATVASYLEPLDLVRFRSVSVPIILPLISLTLRGHPSLDTYEKSKPSSYRFVSNGMRYSVLIIPAVLHSRLYLAARKIPYQVLGRAQKLCSIQRLNVGTRIGLAARTAKATSLS